MSDHSPGPWTRQGRQIRAAVPNNPAMPIASAKLYIIQIGDGTTACDLETAEANARLMAAAPDLLDALRCFIEPDVEFNAEEFTEDYTWRLLKARDAIAKATTGEEPKTQ